MRHGGALCYVLVLLLCVVSQLQSPSLGYDSGIAHAESLYDVLGVSPAAPMDVINKAFRRLAAIYHPDKNRDDQIWAQEQFIRVTQAFEILINPHTRKTYDESGSTSGASQGSGAPVQQNPGVQTSILRLDLKILYTGDNLSLRVDTECLCSVCGGTRVTGAGRSIGNGAMAQGNGEDLAVNDGVAHRHQFGECPACQGSGKENCRLNFHATISKGCQEGARINVPQTSLRTVVKQLVIVVYSAPHEHFRRVGDDLYYTLDITQFEADSGFKTFITHLDDRKIWIASHGGIGEGHVFFFSREGMPLMNSGNRRGDLFVSVHIIDGVAELQDAFTGYYEWEIQGNDLEDNGELWPFYRRCSVVYLSPGAAMTVCTNAGIPWGRQCSEATRWLTCLPFSEEELRFLEEEWLDVVGNINNV